MSVQSKQLQGDMLVPTLLNSGRAELSVFDSTPASFQQIGISVAKLTVAFPQMDDDFFDLLTERISKRGLSAERLDYAINHIIDNYTYQRLTIADIMSIDSRVEVLSYSEMIAECNKRGCTTNEFSPIRIGDQDKPFWVSKADKVKYKLPDVI